MFALLVELGGSVIANPKVLMPNEAQQIKLDKIKAANAVDGVSLHKASNNDCAKEMFCKA
jgi:hypothetical protein